MIIVATLADGFRQWRLEKRPPVNRSRRVIYPNPCWVAEPVQVRLTWTPGPGLDPERLEEGLEADVRTQVVMAPDNEGEQTLGELVYQLKPTQRGLVRLGPCRVRRGSTFGFWWTTFADSVIDTVVVWPRVVELAGSGRGQGRDETGVVGFLQPDQANLTVRTYHPGDDLRRVHWRTSARLGELMSRQEEPMEGEHAWVGLVISADTPEEFREMAISLAASALVGLAEDGYRVELACGSRRTMGLNQQLTDLAALSVAEAADPLVGNAPEGVACLIAIGATSEQLVEYRAFSHRGLAVVDSAEAVAMVAGLGWEGLCLDQTTSLEQAATQLEQTWGLVGT
jgi:uncharacterized protein (DUF58 family)